MIKSALIVLVSSRVPNIFPTLVMQANSLRPAYDLDVPTYPKKEFNDPWLLDALVMTPPSFWVFDYKDWYPTFLDFVWSTCLAGETRASTAEI